jgi:hypothetical protein
VDLTFFQLCDSCLRATKIEDVDYLVISLHNKQFDLLQNHFQENKPAYVMVSSKRIRKTEDEGSAENPKGGKKKSKIQKEEKVKLQY